ncbi:hypothetical protein GPALN_012181 [Globodera pallida]|nr:hypothetical protein GPALN_012181 [Globodera pallida]
MEEQQPPPNHLMYHLLTAASYDQTHWAQPYHQFNGYSANCARRRRHRRMRHIGRINRSFARNRPPSNANRFVVFGNNPFTSISAIERYLIECGVNIASNSDDQNQEGKSFDDEQMLTKTLGDFLPSKLAKDVFFNRKLGVGIFRGDIEPKSKNAENVDGIVFQLLLLVTLGRKSAMLMRKFDEIFLHALRLTFDLPPPIACHVNGIFLR